MLDAETQSMVWQAAIQEELEQINTFLMAVNLVPAVYLDSDHASDVAPILKQRGATVAIVSFMDTAHANQEATQKSVTGVICSFLNNRHT